MRSRAPDEDWWSGWAGSEQKALTVRLDFVVGKALMQEGEGLVGDLASLIAGHTHGAKLCLHPTRTNAEQQPATR